MILDISRSLNLIFSQRHLYKSCVLLQNANSAQNPVTVKEELVLGHTSRRQSPSAVLSVVEVLEVEVRVLLDRACRR